MTVHFEVHKSKVFQSIHFSEVHNASVFQSQQDYKAENLVQLNSDNKRRQERHSTSASETEEGHLRDSKRHKKLNYSPSDLGANNFGHIKPNAPPTENLITSSQLEIPANLNNSFNACGFCHSSRITAVNIIYPWLLFVFVQSIVLYAILLLLVNYLVHHGKVYFGAYILCLLPPPSISGYRSNVAFCEWKASRGS